MTEIAIDLTTTDMLLRLCLAGAIGGLIGYERHIHPRSALPCRSPCMVSVSSEAP